MVGDCDWTSVEVGNKLLIFCILIPLPILVLRTPHYDSKWSRLQSPSHTHPYN